MRSTQTTTGRPVEWRFGFPRVARRLRIARHSHRGLVGRNRATLATVGKLPVVAPHPMPGSAWRPSCRRLPSIGSPGNQKASVLQPDAAGRGALPVDQYRSWGNLNKRAPAQTGVSHAAIAEVYRSRQKIFCQVDSLVNAVSRLLQRKPAIAGGFSFAQTEGTGLHEKKLSGGYFEQQKSQKTEKDHQEHRGDRIAQQYMELQRLRAWCQRWSRVEPHDKCLAPHTRPGPSIWLLWPWR